MKSFAEYIQKIDLLQLYDEKILPKKGGGRDHISPMKYRDTFLKEKDRVGEKCMAGEYKFSPYAEKLILKGKGKAPRVLSIPNVRDRLVLSLLNGYLSECFKNYFAWPIWMNIDKKEEIYLAHNRVEIERCPAPAICPNELSAQFVSPNNKENKLLWAESLTIMRTKMETEADSLIAIGGRLSGFKGYMPGIIQEVGIASELGNPIYIVGAFGGAAGLMSQCILKESTPEKAYKKIKMDDELLETPSALEKYKKSIEYLYRLYDNGLDMLKNGLSEEENKRLLTSVNLTEIVSPVLKGLSIKC